jgi:hypothetical protein
VPLVLALGIATSACSGGDANGPVPALPAGGLEDQFYKLACDTIAPQLVFAADPVDPGETPRTKSSGLVGQPMELECADVTYLARRRWDGTGPDWWVFVRNTGGTALGPGTENEGWLDLAQVCPATRLYEGAGPNVCTAYLAGGATREALARSLNALPLMATDADVVTLLGQVKATLCAPGAIEVYAAPPLIDVFGLMDPGVASTPTGTRMRKVGTTPEDGFCGDVEILGRTREVPPSEGDSPFGDTIVVPWLRVRLGAPVDLEGWVELSKGCPAGIPGVVVCQFYPDWRGGSRPSPAALAIMKELRAVPVAPDPTGTADLGVTAYEAPEPGGPCYVDQPSTFAAGATVKNAGPGATAPRITVEIGGKLKTVEFLRGVRRGESFEVGAGWDETIIVDPDRSLDEFNSANNQGTTPPEPHFVCQ